MRSIAEVAIASIHRRLWAWVEHLGGRFGNRPGLNASQRRLLLEAFRSELARQVEVAKERHLSDRAARRLSLHRSLIRWLEQGEPPGPEAIPFLEGLLSEIPRNPSGPDLAEHEALVAAVHDLGGDAGAAAEIWDEADPELAAGLGRNLNRLMEGADLTVVDLAERSGIEVDAVIALVYGVEEPGAGEILRLSAALGVEPGAVFAGLECFWHVDREAPVEPGEGGRRGGDPR